MSIVKVFYRSPHNYDLAEASDAATIPVEQYGESLTIQSHSEDADINEIMRRFRITGQMPVNVRVPTYGDFTGVNDYQSAIHAIMSAQESFDKMPASVRAKFDNDPALFVDFCSNPDNIEAMREMGLAVPKENGDVGGSGKAGTVDQGASGAAARGSPGDAGSVAGS